MTPPWLKREAEGRVLLTVHVQPGAKRTEVAGVHGDALKIRLAAPPVDGKANDCLLAFLAERLGLARAAVELVSGATARRKRLRLAGVSDAALERLAQAGD
ncbi:MAG: DUF167 domain-containing protein [Pseudomonadota bacterium]